MLEGIVNDGFQYQSVTDVGRPTKMEHVNAPQGGMGVAQATGLTRRETINCFAEMHSKGINKGKYKHILL